MRGAESWGSKAHRRKRAQHFNAVLSGERMRRVHAAEVGQTGRRVGWSPAQDVAQLGGVGVDGVPRHQELHGQKKTQKTTLTFGL